MMIKKVETFWCWESIGAISKDLGVFVRSKPLTDSRYPRTLPKFQKRCCWVSYIIPPNFKTKHWQEIFIC